MLVAAVRRRPAGLLTRALCAAAAERITQRKNAFLILGLEENATPRQIKMRYYELAKRTHPDVLAREAREAEAARAADVQAKTSHFDVGVIEEDFSKRVTSVPFIEVQKAYDFLMAADGEAPKRPAARPGGQHQRERTLGEVLCDKLRDEPEAYAELWEEIVRDKMRVTENMLDALFRAAKRVGKRGDEAAQLAAARSGQRIIIDGTYAGVLTIDTRCSAYVSLLSWCMEHEEALGDLALEIVEQINDEDRAHSPAVMAAIGAVFCSGTRSPY